MRRTGILVGALSLALAASHMSAGESAVRVLSVPAAFPTIQAAVDAAAPGDIIHVSPGIYCEHVVISTPDLRLRAAPAAEGSEAILSGACSTGGFGFHVRGASIEQPVSGVEISGFVVEGFESGIVLQYATGSLIHLNELRENNYVAGSTTPGALQAHGIILTGSSFNDITQNWSHDNDHLGIGLTAGSHGNLVRGNRLAANRGPCSLMLWGTPTNSGNLIVENELTGPFGVGIMVGPSPQIGNLFAQNRVHGFNGRGIVVNNAGSYDNVIRQNDARFNGLNKTATDLFDIGTRNVWRNNLGTCVDGNAACQ